MDKLPNDQNEHDFRLFNALFERASAFEGGDARFRPEGSHESAYFKDITCMPDGDVIDFVLSYPETSHGVPLGRMTEVLDPNTAFYEEVRITLYKNGAVAYGDEDLREALGSDEPIPLTAEAGDLLKHQLLYAEAA